MRLSGHGQIDLPFVRPDEPDQDHSIDTVPDPDRKLIDQLIAATELYSTAEASQALLDFIGRMRAFAPFNAMLLHIQKPGLTYAATAKDWLRRFNRRPKPDARPLIVLRTMGPVDFVFDVQDIGGPPLPDDVFAFPVLGQISELRWSRFVRRVERAGISVDMINAGDGHAGNVRPTQISEDPKRRTPTGLPSTRTTRPPPVS